MVTSSPPRKPISEDKRERDVFLLYGAAFRDIPILAGSDADSKACHLPTDYVTRPSQDSTLTALAQLATFRLGAKRTMISVIDGDHQYVLAETTTDMPLSLKAPGNIPSGLWFGCAGIPRSWGVCENVLKIDLQALQQDEFPTLVIRDLRECAEHTDRRWIKENNVRFYAGAPLFSPSGAIVGVLSIYDDEPRPDGLSTAHQRSLRDLSQSIMDYLHTYTIKDQLWRGERFTRGLISFSEGGSSLLPFKNDTRRALDETQKRNETRGALSSPHDERSEFIDTKQPFLPPVPTSPTTIKAPVDRQSAVNKLQETILPTDAKLMFSRAAHLMLASSDLDGVIILDASVAANKTHQRPGSQGDRSTGTGTDSISSSSDEDSPYRPRKAHGSSLRNCQVLGSAVSDSLGHNDSDVVLPNGLLLEKDLARMLRDYKHGKIMTFGVDGLPLSSTDDSGTALTDSTNSIVDSKPKSGSRAARNIQAIHDMLPAARSVAFVPFWDYERSRWFAGCLCWSNRSHRLLSATTDIPYFKVFSHAVMRELSRLDALALIQLKTTFVASISHELRSPLHGILGTLEFIKDTPLDSFQTSMLNSLNACGQTLLDTINHVMEYAKIGESSRNVSSRRLKSAHTIRLSSKPLKGRQRKSESFDLGIATEEVVEAIFSGSSYVPVSRGTNNASTDSGSDSEVIPQRSTCYIVLDIAPEHDWAYCFPVGPWRRIVMNLFGNALKYTKTGYIHVSLRVNDGSNITGTPTTIALTILDSGMGMSPQFLANKAFHPFSQENSFAAGTGLGLSIVRQIIETNGGKIEINSEPSVGTKLTVKLALKRPEPSANLPLMTTSTPRAQYQSFLQLLEGRTVRILQKHTPEADEGLTRFTNALANTLEKHLKMRVVRSTSWEEHEDDIVIVPELDFDYLASIRSSRIRYHRAPVTVFVAMDGLEAATLRADARVQNKESVVEIMAQPCGPYKLAFILNRCLERYALSEENLRHYSPGNASSPRSLLSKPPSPIPQERLSDTATSATLPIKAATTADAATQSETGSNKGAITIPIRNRPRPGKVLIVDDNPINRKLLIAFMKRLDYSYEEAENGLHALETYQNADTSFKTILMDISMPIMDGMTSTQFIRQHEDANALEPCCIVALTGLASAGAKLAALSSGVDYFMTKPLNFRALERLLKSVDERKAEHSDIHAANGKIGQEKSQEDQPMLGEANIDRQEVEKVLCSQVEDKKDQSHPDVETIIQEQ